MSTFTALTTLDNRKSAETLGESLEALSPPPTGVGVFEVEDGSGTWEVGAYFEEAPDRAALALLSVVHGARDFAVSKLDDRDWVAQVRRELSPVHAGRFVVHGSHDADRVSANQTGLMIEAAMAFGTGHHATTLGCLLLIEQLARSVARVSRAADIGCGTGVLAMAVAHQWRCPVIASDIDQVAVATARQNVIINGVHPWVRTLRAVGTRSSVFREQAPFDLICANILAAPLKRLAPQLHDNLRPGGHAILSGLLTRQIPSVLAVYHGQGFVTEHRLEIGEWTSLIMRRASRCPI